VVGVKLKVHLLPLSDNWDMAGGRSEWKLFKYVSQTVLTKTPSEIDLLLSARVEGVKKKKKGSAVWILKLYAKMPRFGQRYLIICKRGLITQVFSGGSG